MKSFRFISLLLGLLAITGVSGAAFAQPHGDRDRPRREEGGRSVVKVSLDQAVAMAERRYKAKVVRTETRERDGRTIYVLRLLNDEGRVWTVQVDASSGSIN